MPSCLIKHCNICKSEKPYSEFTPDVDIADGLKPCCKDCDNYNRRNRRSLRSQSVKTHQEIREEQREARSLQGLKSCPACKTTKPVHDFSRNRSRKDGLADRCKSCQSSSTKSWYDKHPLNYTAKQNKRLYGLERTHYDALRLYQNDCCAICQGRMSPPHIDHCHKTGHVRALLCASCNFGLGNFKDSPKLLHKAMEYIHNFQRQCSFPSSSSGGSSDLP
jgi:hypothetical protein